MDLDQAQQSFLKLIDSVKPSEIAEFLNWINESFTTKTPDHRDENLCEAEAALHTIVKDLRQQVPINAVLDSERTLWPEYGIESDCQPNTTVHVDSFLYDDESVDEIVEQGLLSRQYCRACGSHTTAPLTFISHSLSVDQLRFIFTTLLPPETLKGKILLDVGSRLGGVLYSAYLYSPFISSLIGVEMNSDLCQIQSTIVTEHNMTDRITIICDDIRNRSQEITIADVLVLNNVFQFFLPPQEQLLCWEFIKCNAKKGSILVTSPDLDTLTDHLEFNSKDWVDKVPTELTAAKYAGSDQEKFEDCSKIFLYQVK